MNRRAFVVTVYTEHSLASGQLEEEIRQALKGVVDKRAKAMGETRLRVYRFGDLEAAVVNFAREIRLSGQDAVDERIR